ncbi:MAG TPA: hypothetical protein VKK31_07270 [Thermoanaerobaculia bacterium]|nr:hypothetical protein [Thermoanaerobaculia bacterium]
MNKVAELLRALFNRLEKNLACRRCRGTGAWMSGDCPDCGGSGRAGNRS